MPVTTTFELQSSPQTSNDGGTLSGTTATDWLLTLTHCHARAHAPEPIHQPAKLIILLESSSTSSLGDTLSPILRLLTVKLHNLSPHT